MQSSEDAVREGTRKSNGMQVWSPVWQMRWQLQQHLDTKLKMPCSTEKFCRHHRGEAGGMCSYRSLFCFARGRREPLLCLDKLSPQSEANPSNPEDPICDSKQETFLPGRKLGKKQMAMLLCVRGLWGWLWQVACARERLENSF